MSESEININLLHRIVLRETENEAAQELHQGQYRLISEFLGKLKREEYDGIERKIKARLIGMTTDLTFLLLKIRLGKAMTNDAINHENLLDEEKFILDAGGEMKERREMILGGILNGKSRLLESIAHKHKTRSVVVRFLQKTDQIVGSDLEKYGPFEVEDIATIPYENAQALMAKNAVTKIRWED